MNNLTMENMKEIFDRLLPGLRSIFGANLDRVILYGSVARGTATDESDIDIAVIVHDYTDEMHNQMIDMAVDLELDYDRVLSVLLINYNNFVEWENVLPFYKNVKQEGMLLYGE